MVATAAVPLVAESRPDGDHRLDIPGATAATAGLALLVYGFTEASIRGWTADSTLVAIGIVVAILIGFVWWEHRAANPMLPLRIVLDRNRAGAYGSFLLMMLALVGTFVLLAYYLQTVRGYTPLTAGIACLPSPLCVITSSTVASRTLPRYGARVLAAAGLVSVAVGMLWLTQLGPHSSYPLHVMPALILIAAGMGHVFVPLSSTALLGVPNHDAGAASALLKMTQQVGGSISVAFLNSVATTATRGYAAGHGSRSAEAVVHGFTTAFTVNLGLLAGALLVVSQVGDRSDTERRLAPSAGNCWTGR